MKSLPLLSESAWRGLRPGQRTNAMSPGDTVAPLSADMICRCPRLRVRRSVRLSVRRYVDEASE